VADRGMARVAAMIARPFVRVEPRAVYRDMLGDEVVAGLRVPLVT
jgi:hypothetical protein